jgi:hypothetical protein
VPEWTADGSRTVPVDRLEPGDHSCMAFTDSRSQWQVLTACTRTSLARKEKVLLGRDRLGRRAPADPRGGAAAPMTGERLTRRDFARGDAGNAPAHGGGAARTVVRSRPGELYGEITDRGPGCQPSVRSGAAGAAGGRRLRRR